MSELAKWYVVHTYSGYENSVAANILKAAENRKMQDLIQKVNIPMETVKEITDSGEKTVERKVFPGYVLVKMVLTDESWPSRAQRARRRGLRRLRREGDPRQNRKFTTSASSITKWWSAMSSATPSRSPTAARGLHRHGGRARARQGPCPRRRFHVRQRDARSTSNSDQVRADQ